MAKRVFIDLREAQEFQRGHIEGALNISPSELSSNTNALHDIDKDSELILYCISGSRSNVAIQILRQQGFTNLVNGININHVKKLYF